MTSRQSLGLSVLKIFWVTSHNSVASQLKTGGVCGYPENASALVTCSLRVFLKACGARSVLQYVKENACPNIKILVFLLVGYAELWNLAFFPRICKMPSAMEDDTRFKCGLWPVWYLLFTCLTMSLHLFSFNLQLRVMVTTECVHKYIEIHLHVRLRVLEMGLLLIRLPWIITTLSSAFLVY